MPEGTKGGTASPHSVKLPVSNAPAVSPSPLLKLVLNQLVDYRPDHLNTLFVTLNSQEFISLLQAATDLLVITGIDRRISS